MLLYNSQISGNCYKVRLLLAYRGIPYERHELDVIDRTNRREVIGELNPALRVPVLVLDDGRALAESDAIAWYLGEGTPWVPADAYDRAKVLEWMFFEQYSHEPCVAVLRFLVKVIGDHGRPPEEIERLRKGCFAAFDAMESRLAGHDWLVGDGPTLADVALYAYTHVAHEAELDLSPYPGIIAWLARFAALPGHVPIDA